MKRRHGGRPISSKRVRRAKRLQEANRFRRRNAIAKAFSLALNAYIRDHHRELGLWSWTTAQVTYEGGYPST